MTATTSRTDTSQTPSHVPVPRRSPFRPDPIPFTDEHGRACLRVPLDRHGRKYATATVRDYQAVQKSGATGVWLLNSNGGRNSYVRTCVAGTLLMPARIISGAKGRSVVRYVNGDPLDLRPENIVLHRGAAKRADADIVVDSVTIDEGGGW